MSLADGRVFDAVFRVIACAHCGRCLPSIPEDDADPVVRDLGRLCGLCHARQEEAR
jgi:hypothetical protein